MIIVPLVLATMLSAVAPPRVAVVYSAWSGNSFQNEYDATLKDLGWPMEKFENRKIGDLVARLGEFDLVVASSVANYENPQDMTPYRDQWLAFLQRGGCLIITDASYATALDQWVNTFGDEFKLTTAQCAAMTDKAADAHDITVVDHPLTTAPNDLAPLLRQYGTIWAHINSWPEGWTSLVACKDRKSLFLVKPVGKGLLIVTSYFSLQQYGRAMIGKAILENAWLNMAARRAGVDVTKLDFGTIAPGKAFAHVGVRSSTGGDVDLRARMRVEPEGQTFVESAPVALTAKAGETAIAEIPYEIKARGQSGLGLVVEDATGQPVLELHRLADIPPALSIQIKRKHLYPRDKAAVVTCKLLPDRGVVPSTLKLICAIDDKFVAAVPAAKSEVVLSASIAGLKVGEHQLRVRFLSGNQTLGLVSEQFFVHPRPRFEVREDGATLLDGKPFFPFGFYHVAPPGTRLKMVQDMAAAGFNCAHMRAMTVEEYGPILDECAKLGVYIVTEFSAPMFETIAKYHAHPAVMGWNPGDEPDGNGVTPEEMFARYDKFKQLDPDHLVYTVSCIPDQYKRYARGTDIFAPDPYPIPMGPMTTVYDSFKRARGEASKYGTTLWGVPQCFGDYGPWTRPPTPKELRGMTYLALLAGVKGIIYYTYQDGQWTITDHPEQWNAAKALVPEIKALAPALLDGKFKLLSEGPEIYAGYWEYEGKRYVAIVNGAADARRFDLAVAGKSAAPMFDAKSDAALDNGRLKGDLEGLGTVVIEVAQQ